MITRVVGFLVLCVLRTYVWAWRKNHCTFKDPKTGDPYLTRWTLGSNAKWPDEQGRTGGEGWYLHCFHRSDWSRNLHNHPALYFVAFPLLRGYRETRREGRDGQTWETWRLPGGINVITADTFHRVTLGTTYQHDEAGTELPAWTLCYIGPRAGRTWGFIQDDGSVVRAGHTDGRTGKYLDRKETEL